MENQISITQLQDFQAKLNREPNPAELGKTPDGKAKTLPISFIEMTLDELFLGQWETSEPTYQQIFNEVVGSLVLTVWHPITNRPIRRVGFASIVITQDKDAAMVDFNTTKKKNALDLSFPKLKAECTKNAAQTLGKIFGRDLNRQQADVYNPPFKTLSDTGFKTLLDRVERGDWQALELAQSNFVLSDIQNSILNGLKPKLLGNGSAVTVTVEELQTLIKEKMEFLTADELKDAKRIIANNETNSFNKLHKLLTDKTA